MSPSRDTPDEYVGVYLMVSAARPACSADAAGGRSTASASSSSTTAPNRRACCRSAGVISK
nr:hypothetical protein [Curtanaerobium respiraculi]